MKEFLSLPRHRQWIWILGGGTVREEDPFVRKRNNTRKMAFQSSICEGRSIASVQDKNDATECKRARDELRLIQQELSPNRLEVWTDGSLTKEDGKTGYGYRIRGFVRGKPTLLQSKSGGLGKGTINQAELTDLQRALQWLLLNYSGNLDREVHIFIDSNYTYKSATCDATRIKRTNFFAIEEILNLGHRLRKTGLKPVIHHCQSHIERVCLQARRYSRAQK